MKLSELQSKDIITMDGKFIGKIIDVNIDSNGKMIGLVVERSKFFISLFSTKNENEIKWENIKKIGEDVIIVELNQIS